MPVSKIEVHKKLFKRVVSNHEQVTVWSGRLIDRGSGGRSATVDVRLFQPCPENPNDVLEVKVSPFNEFHDRNTGERGFTGPTTQVIVYENQAINRMPPLLKRGFREVLVGFVWTPANKEVDATE